MVPFNQHLQVRGNKKVSVTGYLALYTTLIGWAQYQNLWALMVGTGLVFLPFIGIIMKCFLEPFESQEPKSAAVIALRRLMIQTVGALLIIEFCCVPTVTLSPTVLHFEPSCVQNPQIATPGHTGTTYDNQFQVPTGVQVPVLWYLVMAVSNGFTHAASEGLTCSPIDYQDLQDQLDLSRINSAPLKQETISYYNDCYIPAYSKYMSGNLTDQEQSMITNDQTEYGKDDLGWLGSQTFLSIPGFYDSFSAREPITGFTFDPTRDQYEGQVSDHSPWGQPDCKSWWITPEIGLHARLEQALPPSYLQAINPLENKEVIADQGVRSLITHSFDPGMSDTSDIPRGYESLNDDNNSQWYVEATSYIGIASHEFIYYPALYLIINALPVIQALLLLAIYALLAIMIPFSSYKLHFIVTGSAIIFAITFWSYLWQFVSYINNELIGALYPSDADHIIPSWHALLQGGSGIDARFIHFIAGTMYIALPLLFLVLASWAGLTISNAIMGAVDNMKTPVSSAGQAGGEMMRNAAMKTATSVITKSIK
ncbi:MAG: conjugal transfer protein TraG N-terminal domain-containing protein [Gammaproteobacteria bacterium]|nr:conjugal transfer protein TraG N-terminal domain-containing protein [Gammaproteobacteria bacterium]MBY0544827.1 conjugal transfer protein TraG N-terminal domain-containing protein [Gammaproteobacteria bacterium]